MTKKTKPKKYPAPEDEISKVEEPEAVYQKTFRMPSVAEFPYRKFEKIAALVPFTQKEWASMLHLSEKTLQRYSKDNKSFEGIYVDRILQIEQLIKLGLETFVSEDALYRWLKKDKQVLGVKLGFESLNSAQGIQDLTDQLGRIQYGVYT